MNTTTAAINQPTAMNNNANTVTVPMPQNARRHRAAVEDWRDHRRGAA